MKDDRIKFIVFTGACIVLFFIFIITVYLFITGFRFGITASNPPVNVPSGPNEDYNQNFNSNIDIENDASKRVDAVQAIRTKLPHQGNNFSLSYDFDSNVYTAVISSANAVAGNQELDAFLRANGINDRSWMPDLVIVTQ